VKKLQEYLSGLKLLGFSNAAKGVDTFMMQLKMVQQLLHLQLLR
jgi:hypothetical protein